MKDILGILCDENNLKIAATERKKINLEKSVEYNQVESYEKQGWEILRKNKTKVKMYKPKSPDVLFENRVWMIFYNLGFRHMNKDRNFKLKYGSYTKQIDIFAMDNDNIFIVECKSSESLNPINARSTLEEYVGKREDIQGVIEFKYGRHCGRINIIIVISSQDKKEQDEEYVKEKQDKNVLLWSKNDILYIENLIQQLGYTAKYQIYSIIFANKKQKNLKKKYLALRSKMGGRYSYSFFINAKELLNYTYVHHRKLTDIVEATQAYQRMLRSTKIKEIKHFVDDEEGYFANSIIINFSKELKWNRKEKIGNTTVGEIILPEYYGCAWIIDGQHRLFGAASAKTNISIPVLAFENMEPKEQANLFVEINEKQKKVPPDLLWDLYSDIYRESVDEKQKFRYQIIEVAKKLNSIGVFKDYIDIPSIPSNRSGKISLTTVCSTIEKYSPWDHLTDQKNENKTPENAARIINTFFEALKSLWPEDWAKGNNGVLISNNGFGVFMMVFQGIMNHLIYKNEYFLLKENKTIDFEEKIKRTYLKPIVEFLKEDPGFQENIKKLTGRGPQSDNAGILELKIQEFVEGYSTSRTDSLPKIISKGELPAISRIDEKVRSVERYLRNFIIIKLKRHYGSEKWWKLGVPGNLKSKADKKWEEEINRKSYLQKDIRHNERKYEFLSLGELKEVITYGDNWDKLFKIDFGKKEHFNRRIKDISVLRNPLSHTRNIDDQDVADGMGGLLWLSNCIGERRLNPYV
jgi:DNA sulfur modification protein DndB